MSDEMMHMDLVALDTDVLTLELGSCYFDVWHDEDTTSLFYTARALMKLLNRYLTRWYLRLGPSRSSSRR